MARHPLMRLLLPALGVVALGLPVAAAAAEEGTTSTTSTSSATSSAPAQTTTETTTSTAVSAPAEGSAGVAPAGPPAAPQPPSPTTPSTSPKVGGQLPQAVTHAPRVGAHKHGKQSTKGTPASSTQQAEEEAAGLSSKTGALTLPSALTPPLPSSLGASISGVPDFFIESFRIPPFLLPIYQAAGTAYGIPWQVLAAINEVETDYGRDLSVSSAGAEGWMQFLPSSWAQYAVDANGDGFKDPYNPADAIFTAAAYLKAAGGEKNIRGAIFSYNHSQSYVSSVMLRAQLLGGTPPNLLGAITGLTEARFPVHAPSSFSDGFPTVTAGAAPSATARSTATAGPATKQLVGTTIYSQQGAPVIAVQDGQVVAIGDSPTLGHYLSLRDAYGNTYTYAQLGDVAQLYPVLKPHDNPAGSHRITRAGSPVGPSPTSPASAGVQPHSPISEGALSSGLALGAAAGLEGAAAAPVTPPILPVPAAPAAASSAAATPRVFRSGPDDVYLHPLHVGVQVIAGTVLGHIGASAGNSASAGDATSAGDTVTVNPATGQVQPHMVFQLRPAGVGAQLIDPKPILDGWVQLEQTSIFRAKGENPFLASSPTVGQVLLESKSQLEQQVLHDPGISIYACGRQDIETGQIDRRVLATLEFLSVSGLKPTVSALKCGHSELTTEGNVSEHSSGNAVDISAINGVPIDGHQGPGSITDTTIRKLLMLQGAMKPHQIISLMSYPGTDNTLSMPDHYNHIHVGFRPLYAADASSADASTAGELSSTLSPDQWIKLVARLGEIPDPNVAGKPSTAALPDHAGEAAGEEAAEANGGASKKDSGVEH